MNDGATLPGNLPDLREQKKLLRAQVLSRRDLLSAAQRAAASRDITGQLQALPAYRQARSVLAYMGFGSEVDTTTFVEQVLHDGKLLALPRIDRATRSLQLHRIHRLDQLVAGVWGIREPDADANPLSMAEIDFVLMPGVAFDRRGGRLGYGAGFYDRLLADGPSIPRAQRVAAAFDVQIVDEVPCDAHDQRLDVIISENRIFHPNQSKP
jgi:5-formyltetrahydrofolate cyclo-ligase